VVGIVVVSHSRALAHAAVGLAAEMLHGADVRIAVAAGLDDGTSGTDAAAIARAVTEADAGDGVVVLMDLGSAVLSAELALDLLEDERRSRVLLSPAPLVEGLVVAAVAAAGGAGRDEVLAETRRALVAKAEQLGDEVPAEAPAAAGGGEFTGETGAFAVAAEHGLHARPAARLVALVRGTGVAVELRNATTGSAWVPAVSLSRVAALGVRQGHEVAVRAAGPGAAAAVRQVVGFGAGGLGETPAPGPVLAPAGAGSPGRAGPVAASPGIGIGPASPAVGDEDAPDPPPGTPREERARLAAAVAAARDDVRAVRDRVAGEAGAAEAAIFEAHLALLDDPELAAEAETRIAAGEGAGPAWSAAVGSAADALEALDDAYLRARAADVRDVGRQVRSRLRGGAAAASHTGVLVAPDLSPAEAAALDRERVVAVVLAYGSPTAHSSILARARGIPVVTGAGPEVLELAPGTPLAVDGSAGEVVVAPSEEVVAGFRTRAEALARRRAAAMRRAGEPAVTLDGTGVVVGANLGSVEDARLAAASGADVAGLVRTEFLFLGRDAAPGVDEQVAAYRELAAAMEGRRLTLRTLDVGGDKPLGYLPVPAAANPFLGVRGLRLSLARPGLLADQLLAMVRVAHETPVSVMFPMVTTVAELTEARRLLAAAVRACGGGEPAGLEVGIMVEVPAAALKAAAFAPLVDFLSIGTNDLTQYATAAERGNAAVGALGDPFDPGVLRLVEAVVRDAGDRLVSVCGELAADPRGAALLVGLGIRELSVSPAAVPPAKDAVRRLSAAGATTIARRALQLPGAEQVRSLLGDDA
jgi:phosphoenolpyruvate-protein phosphotransferase/dihydroxyacetone kinase phosphotransfer subunit